MALSVRAKPLPSLLRGLRSRFLLLGLVLALRSRPLCLFLLSLALSHAPDQGLVPFVRLISLLLPRCDPSFGSGDRRIACVLDSEPVPIVLSALECCDARLLHSATSEAAAAKAMIRRLEDEATRWRAARSTAEGLERAWECTLGSRDEIRALRARLETEAIETREALQGREAEKRQLEAEQALLRETGGKVAPEMAALRDQVAGELLAASYEDIAIEDAATAEARLGPLAGAIVVDDPESAAVDILQAEARPDSVWLIARDKVPNAESEHRAEAHVFEDDVIVEGDDGAWRITRKPASPILGRRARTRRLEELKQEARSTAAQITRARGRLEAVQGARAGTDTLLADADLIEAGDPGPKMDAEHRRAEQCEADATVRRRACGDLDASIASERDRLDALNALLHTAWLLDEHSYREQHKVLEDRLRAARAGEKELKAKAAGRAVLEEKIDVLRTVPPSQEKEQELRERLESRTQRAHNLTAAQRALEEALRNPAALKWTDAPAALNAKRALVPTLKAQLDQAKSAAERARATLDAASEDLNKAVLALNGDDAGVNPLGVATLLFDRAHSALCVIVRGDHIGSGLEVPILVRQRLRLCPGLLLLLRPSRCLPGRFCETIDLVGLCFEFAHPSERLAGACVRMVGVDVVPCEGVERAHRLAVLASPDLKVRQRRLERAAPLFNLCPLRPHVVEHPGRRLGAQIDDGKQSLCLAQRSDRRTVFSRPPVQLFDPLLEFGDPRRGTVAIVESALVLLMGGLVAGQRRLVC